MQKRVVGEVDPGGNGHGSRTRGIRRFAALIIEIDIAPEGPGVFNAVPLLRLWNKVHMSGYFTTKPRLKQNYKWSRRDFGKGYIYGTFFAGCKCAAEYQASSNREHSKLRGFRARGAEVGNPDIQPSAKYSSYGFRGNRLLLCPYGSHDSCLPPGLSGLDKCLNICLLLLFPGLFLLQCIFD